MWALQITAGRGPVEARAFVARLASALRPLLAQRDVEITAEAQHGPPAAPWSVTLMLAGADRPPLADLLGTHCEIRRSPSRGRRARKRWFAGVSLHPIPHADRPLRPDDVRYQTCRARGPGGQHVNRRATAVRATHGPSGVSARADRARSQAANRTAALAQVVAALHAHARADADRAQRTRRRAHDQLERGRPVRTWRLP